MSLPLSAACFAIQCLLHTRSQEHHHPLAPPFTPTSPLSRDYRSMDHLDAYEREGIDEEYTEEQGYEERQAARMAAESEIEAREVTGGRRRRRVEALEGALLGHTPALATGCSPAVACGPSAPCRPALGPPPASRHASSALCLPALHCCPAAAVAPHPSPTPQTRPTMLSRSVPPCTGPCRAGGGRLPGGCAAAPHGHTGRGGGHRGGC